MAGAALEAALVIVGSVVSAYGITLAIHAGFGCATLAVLWQGVSLATGLSLGGASALVAAAMVVVALTWDREQIGVGTVAYQAVYSASVDLFSGSHGYFGQLLPDLLLMVAGIAVFAVGTGVYASTSHGRGSYEAFSFSVAKRFGLGVPSARIACDAGVVLLGALLGGTFGLCTVFTALIVGPVLGATVKVMDKLLANKQHAT